jgi:hypothetical protein
VLVRHEGVDVKTVRVVDGTAAIGSGNQPGAPLGQETSSMLANRKMSGRPHPQDNSRRKGVTAERTTPLTVVIGICICHVFLTDCQSLGQFGLDGGCADKMSSHPDFFANSRLSLRE